MPQTLHHPYRLFNYDNTSLRQQAAIQHMSLPAACALGAIVGCATYYLLAFEPLWHVGLWAIPMLPLLVRMRWVWAAFFVLFAGIYFSWAAYSTQANPTVMLPEMYQKQRHWVTGQVVDISHAPKRDRVLLGHVTLYGVPEKDTPERVYISTSAGRFGMFQPGSWMAVQARLSSPDAPLFDGAFDLQRYDFLNGIGARGFVMGEIYPTSGPDGAHWFTGINAVRHTVGRAFEREEESTTNGLVRALVTGQRGGIAPDVRDAFAQSGLGHLLAISGLHVGLMAGVVFMVLRAFFSAFPPLALRLSTKKMAAMGAFIAMCGYVLLAGATVPTLRAGIMLGLLFMAFLLERTRQAVRVLCFAVPVVLALWPEDVLGPSFQMSFIAAFCLCVWVYIRTPESYSHFRLVQAFDYIRVLWLTSFVATLATLPFIVWHFQMVSAAGVVANLLAIPLMGLIIMPAAVLGLALLPFGLHALPVFVMHQGVELLHAIATLTTESLLGGFYLERGWAVIVGMFSLGIFACLLFQKRLLALGAVGCMAVLVAWGHHAPNVADVMAFDKGAVILVRTASASSSKPAYAATVHAESYRTRRLLRHVEDSYNLSILTDAAPCAGNICSVSHAHGTVLVPQAGEIVLPETCALASYVLVPQPWQALCANAIVLGSAPQEELWLDGKKRFTYVPNTKRIWR